jgi:uncharacterized protein (DUF608 family)
MPVGGICAGQLYLGGDGKLWHWDIFNKVTRTGAEHYADPPQPKTPLEQGFALQISTGSRSQTRALDHTGWREVEFCGEYPIGFVEYSDPETPVRVSLEAFSPFIPLNPEDSALPATVMRFTVRNTGDETVTAELAGWLENAVCLYSAESIAGQRHNRILRRDAFTFLECDAEAKLQIAEDERGGRGNIGVDGIPSRDSPRGPGLALQEQPDFGTMGLALLKPEIRSPEVGTDPKAKAGIRGGGATAQIRTSDSGLPGTLEFRDAAFASLALGENAGPLHVFAQNAAASESPASKSFGHKLVGSLSRRLNLPPGRSATVTFVVAWHFPNIKLGGLADVRGRWYGLRFANALAVIEYIAKHFDRLHSETRRWHDTWYDATLPYWFLDRTLLNISILATNTCYWFANGRFYAWEGVGCCEGTCTHVWHYAQALARLFPTLERSLRETVDYGVAFNAETGRIRFRAEHNDHWAVDGQAGVILRTWREHQMSADGAFLSRVWPRAKKALEFLISKDTGADGIIDGPQHNTLDADWWGHVAWLSGLYLAALRAGEEMALEIGDVAFAQQCREILEKGRRLIDERLFNGEYYIQLGDPARAKTVGSYDGCEIDQVLGESWAWQVGLGRILKEANVKTALRSLWRYNFTPDVGPYRAVYKPGRWFAMPGEGGLLMCTWPRGEAQRVKEGFDFYFNECMSGFEYQVAGHMIAEGMLLEGLAITRMIHDRYHPARRNPWNEIECGDHYARSMASYGVFLAACGYQHHGPKAHLGFAPRVTPENFKCAFTTAEGWGSFHQQSTPARLECEIQVRWGRLRLHTLSFALAPNLKPTEAKVFATGKVVPATFELNRGEVKITLINDVTVIEGDTLCITLT